MKKILMLVGITLLIDSSVLLAQNTFPECSEPEISVVGKRINLLGENYDLNRYSSEAELTLVIRNNCTVAVSAWRAVFTFIDPFGDEMFKVQLTSGKADIRPRDTEVARFTWEDNQFLSDEPYDYLSSFDAGNIAIVVEEIRVVH